MTVMLYYSNAMVVTSLQKDHRMSSEHVDNPDRVEYICTCQPVLKAVCTIVLLA